MYIDDIKLFAKNEKEWETLIQAVSLYSRFGMCFCDNEKRKMTNDGKNSTTKSKKNALRKRNLQILGHIKSGYHRTSREERNF